MNHEHATQLADWIANNTRGYARRNGKKIYLEGTIDAFELLLYAQTLLHTSHARAIYEDNRVAYTGRIEPDRVNAVVEGADW